MATAHHLFLKLVVDGSDIVGFVRDLGASLADACVVGAAEHFQEAFVFLTDLFLQVEGGFNQKM